MNETWLPVVGYEDFYEVSDVGRVRRNGRVLRPETDKDGYRKVVLCKFGTKKKFFVHRLVATAFLGDGTDMQVNHKNGVTGNNALGNLEWVDQSQNTQHAMNVLGRVLGHRKIPVIALNSTGQMQFESLRDAQRKGFHKSAILKCLSGAFSQHRGYRWLRAPEHRET